MLFSSMIFLWVFLPIVIIGNFLLSNKWKNIWLLLASFVFYAWEEPKFLFLMIITIIVNYIFGILIDITTTQYKRKLTLFFCIIINLGFLLYFKYFNFILENVTAILNLDYSLKTIILPIGISFYTFQALSYVIDVYRTKAGNGNTYAQRNIINMALYIALFPQLIAGPIVKYHDISAEISSRHVTINDFAYGIKRFLYGLGKKVLIANTLALTVDEIFMLNSH